jgi:signal transduction histidine kinase
VRVTYKLTLVLVLGMTVVLSIDAVVRLQRQVALFENDMRQDTSLMGRNLAGLVEQLWRAEGEARVTELLARTTRSDPDVNIRLVWLDAPPGAPGAPALPVPADLDGQLTRPGADGESVYTYVPVAVDPARRGAIEVREALTLEREYLSRTKRNVALASAAMLATSALLAVVAGVRLVGRPMHRLVDMARRVGQGDLAARAALAQRDEIGELAREMDAMAERLQAAFERIERETAGRIAALEQLRHADRLATVGQLASGLAHELGTPLNVVSGRARLIQSGDLTPAETAENARSIVEQSARMTTIIRQLLDYARRRSAQKAPLDLRVPLRRTIDMLSRLTEKARARVEVAAPDEVVVDGDATHLEQVVTNLVVNAVQAMPDGGVVKVAVGRAHARPPGGEPEREVARLSVTDEGAGIPAAALPRLFEPFFTTKGPGEGTGLGLSVTQGIVVEHGGWITVESAPGRGTTFDVFLPLAGEERA